MKIQIKKDKNLLEFISWPIWKCEPSKFNWEYDQEEHCYIIEGSVKITTDEEIIEIQSGDYVIFPKGLKCIWEVRNSIKKHYSFI